MVAARMAIDGKRQELRQEACLWDIGRAASALGLSVHTLYAWVNQRRIVHVKAGRRVMFDPKDIQAWIEEHKVLPEQGRISKLT